MQGTIEVISSTGKGFRIIGQDKGAWFNKGKNLDEDLIAGLVKGDKVEFNAPDGKWVVSLHKLDAGAVVKEPMADAKKVFANSSAHEGATEKSNSIARGCAANAVLGSPYLADILAGEVPEQTVQNVKDFMEKVAEFVYSGKW